MTTPVRLMIVDDDMPLRKHTADYLSRQPGIQVTAQAGDVQGALALLRQDLPDVLLLDIVMPGHNGFDLLKRMSREGLHGVKVIMFSDMNSTFYKSQANKYQVSAYIPKDGSILRNTYETILDVAQGPAPLPTTPEPVMEAGDILQAIGVPRTAKGFAFLAGAAKLAAEDESLLRRLTSELYPRVGQMHGTSSSNVERDMRSAIRTAWTRTTQSALDRALGAGAASSKRRPSSGELIALVASRLREG